MSLHILGGEKVSLRLGDIGIGTPGCELRTLVLNHLDIEDRDLERIESILHLSILRLNDVGVTYEWNWHW
jgi:hypothetical protein